PLDALLARLRCLDVPRHLTTAYWAAAARASDERRPAMRASDPRSQRHTATLAHSGAAKKEERQAGGRPCRSRRPRGVGAPSPLAFLSSSGAPERRDTT